jgi:hypothetical protein
LTDALALKALLDYGERSISESLEIDLGEILVAYRQKSEKMG